MSQKPLPPQEAAPGRDASERVHGDGRKAVQGLRIDRYVVIEQLGRGGMGVVYKAYDTKLERTVALKVIRSGKRGEKKARMGRLLMVREAQALAQLSHPNVIAVHDVGTVDNNVFITMELAEGLTLKQWVEHEKPSREEILNVMVAAGRGLEAAHNAGLVHRDFKPSNVIVGRDGVVRVIDFGLARAPALGADVDPDGNGSHSLDSELEMVENSGTQYAYASPARARGESLGAENPDEHLPESHDTLAWSAGDLSSDSITPGKRLLMSPLTQAGSVVGTPLYMAPEQVVTINVDARADQYSFCVVLFELLYRVDPFRRESLEELRRIAGDGAGDLPEPERDVPQWLRRVVERGISSKPGERFESMEQLLQGLMSDPEVAAQQRRAARLRAALWGAAAVVLLSAPAAVWYEFSVRQSQLCQGAEERISAIWNPKAQTKIRDALVATALPYAKDTAERAAKFFDDYAAQWAAMYTNACRATQVRGVQSAEVMDLRMSCLKRRLVEMGTMTGILGEADARVAEKASTALASLTPVATCADVEALQAPQRGVEPPKDEETARRVEETREKLGEVRMLFETGKYKEGLELARHLEKQAEISEYQPLQAEVGIQLGKILAGSGDYESAEAALYEALRASRASKAGVVGAYAITELVWVIGYRQAKHKEALALGRAGEVLFAVIRGTSDRQWARLLNNMGVVLDEEGAYDEALNYYRKALQVEEKVLGNEHPQYGATLNNIGLVYHAQGKYQQALKHLLMDLRISEKALGAEHPGTAATLSNIGFAHYALGENDTALSYYRNALAIKKATLGATHTETARTLMNIGSLLVEQGDHDEALEILQTAVAIREQTVGKDSPGIAFSLDEIAWVFTERGEYERALRTYDRALRIREKALGPKHGKLATTLHGIGRTLLAQGRHAEAIAQLERALAVCREKICDRWAEGGVLFTLARALVLARSDPERAVKLAEEARATYGKTPQAYEKDVVEIDEWLREQGVR